MFFSKGSGKLITVPSCSEHNGGKSSDDEYLFLMNSINILANKDGQNIANNKSIRAIKRNKRLMQELAENARTVYVENLENGTVEKTFAFEIDYDKMEDAIKAIAKGLYFYEFQEVFYGDISVTNESAMFLDKDNIRNKHLKTLINLSNKIFDNSTKKGENPQIFYYQIERIQKNTIIKICFYENVSFTALLKIKPRLIQSNTLSSIRKILY